MAPNQRIGLEESEDDENKVQTAFKKREHPPKLSYSNPFVSFQNVTPSGSFQMSLQS